MYLQSTSNIMMVRPAAFGYNQETAGDNSFQHFSTEKNVQAQALQEFDSAVSQIREAGVNVFVLQDTHPPLRPDAIFPNNWISMMHDGTVYLFPMLAKNRRTERLLAWENLLQRHFQIKQVKDWSATEAKEQYLEGTGSIIFDHLHRIAYASASIRTNKSLFFDYCSTIAYKPVFFNATDQNAQPYYHTNVILSVGKSLAVICSEAIEDIQERALVLKNLRNAEKEVIEISREQVNAFAGNILQVASNDGHSVLIMSKRARSSYDSTQLEKLKKHGQVLSLSIDQIEETGGGSARCMLAEIFLPTK
jgi:hypothetical protein